MFMKDICDLFEFHSSQNYKVSFKQQHAYQKA